MEADSKLQLSGSSLQIQQHLVQISLLGLKGRNLILHFHILVFLVQVRVSQIFAGFEDVIGQSLPNFLSFSRQSVIESVLLRPQLLNLFLVKVELLLSRIYGFLKAVDLALQGGGESTRGHRLVLEIN